MNYPNRIFSVVLILGLAGLACAIVPQTQPTPKPVDPQVVQTAIKQTLQAQGGNPAAASSPIPLVPTAFNTPVINPTAEDLTATPTPARSTGILPRALFFLGPDNLKVNQVWRLAPDASKFASITAETADVTDFAVTSDGKLAYITQNRLMLKVPGIAGTKVIADGGDDDGSDNFRYTKLITNPAWSSDGVTLAFGMNGVNLVSTRGGVPSLKLPNSLDNQDGLVTAKALYKPEAWSPDGSRLLIDVSFNEGAGKTILTVGNNKLLPLTGPDGSSSPCCTAAWTRDGKTIYLAGYEYGANSSEIWQYDAQSGQGTLVVPATAPDGSYNFSDWPYQNNDQLLYFYANEINPPTGGMVLMKLVSSKLGKTDQRTVLQAEPRFISDTLWAPDGHLAVVILPELGEPLTAAPHGAVAVLFTDGQPTIQLIHDGHRLVWGP